MKYAQDGGVLFERGQHMTLLEDQSANIDDAVAEKELSAQAEVRCCDRHLNAHGGDDQRLVIGETDAVNEECDEEVTILARSVNPSEDAQEHDHEGGDTECVNLDNDGLAPHESVEAKQHAGDK